MTSTAIPSAGLRRPLRPAVRTVRQPAGRAAARGAGTVRLTARGRAVLVLALALLLFGAFSLGSVGAEGSTDAAPAVEVTTVLPGDTLWSVAKRIAPGQDPRPVVDQIVRLNDLSGAGLRAGQQLLLPAHG
jgi:Tfp pilus assembly protein FimV